MPRRRQMISPVASTVEARIVSEKIDRQSRRAHYVTSHLSTHRIRIMQKKINSQEFMDRMAGSPANSLPSSRNNSLRAGAAFFATIPVRLQAATGLEALVSIALPL